jgi:ADP-heptose:LPS heptosyltransferase
MSIARRNGLDVDGLHLYNNEVFLRQWGRYLKTRTFTEKILIRRRMALGDVLMLTPIIALLKAENPNREIDVETEYPAIFRGNPNVRAAYQGGGPGYTQFDRILDMDLAYELDPQKHILTAYANLAGVINALPSVVPSIYPNALEHDIASRMLGSSQKWAALHLGPGNVVGRTVPTRLLVAVEKHLKSQGWSVLWIQSGAYSLHVLAALLQQCRLFVGADSGPMHLAQAARIPTVGIFGAVDPQYRLLPGVPYFRGVTAPGREVGCLGCHHVYEPPMTGSKCLRHGSPQNNLCMEKLRVEDVIRAIEEVLACPLN